jgi:RNA polymerase sigma-70 factor (ECF subfamily)
MDDGYANWIARARGGDAGAWFELHAARAGAVKAYFLRSGFDHADADDLTQDTFVRAFRSFSTYDPERGGFATWLAAIARNVARKRWQKPDPPDDFDPQLAEEVFAALESPDGSAADQEEIDALSRCIDRLPPELARIVHLRYVQGRSIRGITAETELPESTVGLRLREINGLLARCLRGQGVLE